MRVPVIPVAMVGTFEAKPKGGKTKYFSKTAAVVGELLGLDPGGNADIAAAQAILAKWDYTTTVKSRGAALAILTAQAVITGRDSHDPKAPTPRKALLETIKLLKTHHGRLDPGWGQVNRIRRGAVDLPIDGGPDTLRAVYGKAGDDGRLTALAGDTFIMFVTWDSAGVLSSQSIHQFGTATLDAGAPHYSDQAPLFAAQRFKPVLFTEDQLAGNIVETYRPGQRTTRR